MYDTLRFRADAQHSSSQKVVNSFLPSRPLPSPWSGEEEAFNNTNIIPSTVHRTFAGATRGDGVGGFDY